MDTDRHVDLLTSPDLSVAWISVTKCASAFIRQTLYKNNWFEPSPEICEAIRQSEDIPKLIVLRDPVQRWISGFSQCFGDNPDIIKLLEQEVFWDTIAINPVFDGHTEYQHKFHRNAKNTKYIYMQSWETRSARTFYNQLSAWLTGFNYSLDLTGLYYPVNSYESDPAQCKVYLYLRKQVENKYRQMLTDLHKPDYELLDYLPKLKI